MPRRHKLVNHVGFCAIKPCRNEENTEMTEEKKEIKLEEAFEKLDGMLDELESPDISLEESFQVYQEGMKLLKQCNEIIDRVEKSVLKLNENGELEEF